MKLKKILALAFSLVMCVSVIASTTLVANAEVAGAEVILEFAGYETAGTTTFAKVDVKLNIPDTLIPYAAIEPDWENTFDYTYEGLMLQGVAIDVPYVDGLQFIKAKSTVASAFAAAGLAVNANAATSCAQVVYANTSTDYSTYYAGELGTIATLWYRITGNVDGTYELAASNVVVGLSAVDEATGALNNSEYKFADFATTAATIQPGIQEEPVNTIVPSDVKAVVKADTIDGVPTDYQYGSGLAMTAVAPEGVAFTNMIWAITTDAGRMFSKAVAIPNLNGEFKVAATFINGNRVDDGHVAFDENSVGAIFTDGTAEYFTNADDAAYKAEKAE